MIDDPKLSFQLTSSPQSKGLLLLLVFACAVGEVVILLAYSLGAQADDAIAVSVMLPILATAVLVGFLLMNRGSVLLVGDRVEVQSWTSSKHIPLTDIASAELRTTAQLGAFERALTNLFGAAQTHTFVEISLNLPYRESLLPWQAGGTQVVGLPSFPKKTLRLFVSRPAELVDAVGEHLRTANPTTNSPQMKER